jgi:hypothetical protein
MRHSWLLTADTHTLDKTTGHPWSRPDHEVRIKNYPSNSLLPKLVKNTKKRVWTRLFFSHRYWTRDSSYSSEDSHRDPCHSVRKREQGGGGCFQSERGGHAACLRCCDAGRRVSVEVKEATVRKKRWGEFVEGCLRNMPEVRWFWRHLISGFKVLRKRMCDRVCKNNSLLYRFWVSWPRILKIIE